MTTSRCSIGPSSGRSNRGSRRRRSTSSRPTREQRSIAVWPRRAASRFRTGTSTIRATRSSARRRCRRRRSNAAIWRAYSDFYRWGSIARGAPRARNAPPALRHFAYAAGWKKFEPLWDIVIRAKRAGMMLPVLETILSEFGTRWPARRDDTGVTAGPQLDSRPA